MSAPFPFGFAPATALYLALFVVTWAVHYLFVAYLVAGTAAMALARLLPSPGLSTLARATSDFSTFAMSAAITAGVAPLLFVQILYRARMYTASLLLSHRFMAILPALVVAFYALYAQKTRFAEERPRLRLGLTALALAGLAFVASAWVENHVLGRDDAAWPAVYAAGPLSYANAEKLPRLALYLGLSPLVFVPQVALQLALRARRGEAVEDGLRALSAAAVVGAALAAGALALAFARVPGLAAAARGPAGAPWALAAAVGLAASFALARGVARSGSVAAAAGAVGAALVGVVGLAAVRELVRLEGLDVARLGAEHAEALAKGGLWLFLAFLTANAAACVWIVRAVGRARADG